MLNNREIDAKFDERFGEGYAQTQRRGERGEGKNSQKLLDALVRLPITLSTGCRTLQSSVAGSVV